MTRLLLASASPSRRAILQNAGIRAQIQPSEVDEDAAVEAAAEKWGELEPSDHALLLAQAKAEDVAGRADAAGAVVLGCDSVLELDGEVYGKPGTAETASARWKSMRGRAGILHSGHWIYDERDTDVAGTGATFGAVASTTVHFADVTDREIERYVASREPLNVAGGFTIDGLGGPFVTSIEGDHHNVLGLSLPLLREMLTEIGIAIPDLWSTTSE